MRDARVAAGNYGNTSEYIRDLVRRDQEEQAKKRLRDQIEVEPGIGSPVLGKVLDIPGLRTWRISKFPLLWFYFERGSSP